MKYAMGCAGALILAAVCLPAQAQFAKPEDAIKYRKASFTVMAAHFGGSMPFSVELDIKGSGGLARCSWAQPAPAGCLANA
jgi:hypothetical protein